jgi:hypothetical protein
MTTKIYSYTNHYEINYKPTLSFPLFLSLCHTSEAKWS